MHLWVTRKLADEIAAVFWYRLALHVAYVANKRGAVDIDR